MIHEQLQEWLQIYMPPPRYLLKKDEAHDEALAYCTTIITCVVL